ncbi:MAG TPA: sugar ABC transporter permease [Chloroflexota bacterium]|nr:sugar ABC transporter permease [Chloroflexota bacterium]
MRRSAVVPWLFLTPALVIYTVFRIVPLLGTIGLSLTRYQGIGLPIFIGLTNYLNMLQDPVFWEAIQNNLIWGIVHITIGTSISLFLAVLLNSKIRLRSLFRTSLFLPVVLSWAVAGLLWDRIYQPTPSFGLINHLFQVVHHPELMHNWLGDGSTALAAVIVASLWKGFGFSMIIFLAGLQDIPLELTEAAGLDGASAWQIFWQVTLPLLRPIVSIVLVLGLIDAFRVFDPIYVMTQGGPGNASEVIGTQVYEVAFSNFNLGYGSALAMALLLLALAATLLYLRFFGIGEAY